MKEKKVKKEFKPGIIESFKLLWKFMGKKERITFITIIFLSVIAALTQTYCALLPAIIIARFSGENLTILSWINLSSLSTPLYLFIVCGVAVLLWVFGMLIYRMVDIFSRRMICIVNEKAQNIILLERKNLDFGMTVGETNYIVKNAVDNIYQILEPFCWRFCTNILSVLYMVIQLFLLNVYVGLMAIALVLIILIGVLIRTKAQEKVVGNIESTNAKIGNHFLQSLTNLPMITMFQSKKRELEELKKLNSKFFKENKKRANIGYWYWTIIIAIEYIGLAGIVAIYVSFASGAGLVAAITIIINELLTIYGMVENWGYLVSDMQTAAIKFCNLQKIYPQGKFKDIDESKALNDKNLKDKKLGESIEKIDKKGINQVDVVGLTVAVGTFKKTYDITFTSGNVYLICGQSGQGKTTLVNAICGLREITDGYLLVNKKHKMKSLYNLKQHISYLFQDSVLFDRSIAENIAYPDAELSARAEELSTEFGLNKLLKRQTNASVSSSLSGGEKKRIDIVRTISKDKDIYFLDEPTNELDQKNVEKVLSAIKDLSERGKIVIVISHDERLKTIATQIVEL